MLLLELKTTAIVWVYSPNSKPCQHSPCKPSALCTAQQQKGIEMQRLMQSLESGNKDQLPKLHLPCQVWAQSDTSSYMELIKSVPLSLSQHHLPCRPPKRTWVSSTLPQTCRRVKKKEICPSCLTFCSSSKFPLPRACFTSPGVAWSGRGGCRKGQQKLMVPETLWQWWMNITYPDIASQCFTEGG